MKVFEAEHWSRQPLDASMVLLDDVIQVFALTDFNAFVMVSIKLFQARMIGSTLINVDQARFAVFLEGFPQKV